MFKIATSFGIKSAALVLTKVTTTTIQAYFKGSGYPVICLDSLDGKGIVCYRNTNLRKTKSRIKT